MFQTSWIIIRALHGQNYRKLQVKICVKYSLVYVNAVSASVKMCVYWR
jgi:hypothetical protein